MDLFGSGPALAPVALGLMYHLSMDDDAKSTFAFTDALPKVGSGLGIQGSGFRVEYGTCEPVNCCMQPGVLASGTLSITVGDDAKIYIHIHGCLAQDGFRDQHAVLTSPPPTHTHTGFQSSTSTPPHD